MKMDLICKCGHEKYIHKDGRCTIEKPMYPPIPCPCDGYKTKTTWKKLNSAFRNGVDKILKDNEKKGLDTNTINK